MPLDSWIGVNQTQMPRRGPGPSPHLLIWFFSQLLVQCAYTTSVVVTLVMGHTALPIAKQMML